MKFALIDAEKAKFPVDFMCGELGVSRSGYYAWRGRAPSARDQDDRELTAKVVVIHADSLQTCGTRRVQAQLRREGKNVSRKRLSRRMATADLTTKRKKRFRRTTDSNHAFPVAENLLERRFTVERPDQVWVTDITYVWTGEGWLYLAALVDLYARRVVGWSMAEHMERQLCLDALELACKARHPPPPAGYRPTLHPAELVDRAGIGEGHPAQLEEVDLELERIISAHSRRVRESREKAIQMDRLVLAI